MKVVYNWLKDFVDATAPPEELASRLALAGTNIGSLENGPHGAVIDAEIGSNRPDCLGHYGIAREVAEAIGTVRTDFRVDDRAVRAVFETSDIRSGKREPRGEFLRRRGGVDKVLQPVVDDFHGVTREW